MSPILFWHSLKYTNENIYNVQFFEQNVSKLKISTRALRVCVKYLSTPFWLLLNSTICLFIILLLITKFEILLFVLVKRCISFIWRFLINDYFPIHFTIIWNKLEICFDVCELRNHSVILFQIIYVRPTYTATMIHECTRILTKPGVLPSSQHHMSQ